MTSRRGTLAGLAAIVLWSAMTGLIRTVTDSFGATLGVALIYTLAAAGLWVTRRPRRLRSLPLGYLLIGGGLFVAYEVAVGLSLGLASNASQTIQVSIVNYLWPTLTMLLRVMLSRGRGASWLLVPGVALATAGIIWVVGGNAGLSPARIAMNVSGNPLPYALALTGALAFAFYSVFSPRLSDGQDGITVFVTAVAIALWIVHEAAGAPAAPAALHLAGIVALLAAAAVIAAGYACWDIGLLSGNTVILASASYATPVLSSAVAAALLGTTLPVAFWQGVALVVAGSLLSWHATRDRGPATAHVVPASRRRSPALAMMSHPQRSPGVAPRPDGRDDVSSRAEIRQGAWEGHEAEEHP